MLNTDRVNNAKGYWASRDCLVVKVVAVVVVVTRGYTYSIDNQCYFDSYPPIHAIFKPIWEFFWEKKVKNGPFC